MTFDPDIPILHVCHGVCDKILDKAVHTDSEVHQSILSIGTASKARPVYTGILIQTQIQIGSAFWIQIQTQTTSPTHVVCDPDSNPDSGPGARVNISIDSSYFKPP